MSEKLGSNSIGTAIRPNDGAQSLPTVEPLLSFDDLVVGHSLSPVKVIIKQTKDQKGNAPDHGLLTELQCEV